MTLPITLNDEEKRELLQAARSVLETYLRERSLPDLDPKSDRLKEKGGAFVTLKGRVEGELRGCIGHVEADRPLFANVRHMAVEAATGDPRFRSLRAEDLDAVEIEISVLTPPRELSRERFGDIVPGRHGLIISQGGVRGWNRGLLLPQVAEREGWDGETFLAATCRKAGLAPDAWRDARTRIEIFTAEVFSERDFST